jgi:enoyl-[acyl-carrier protein] reductase III
VEGKTILVTGGTRGIGRAIVERLVSEGATVIANYVRSRKHAESLQSQLGEDRLVLVKADLSREKGMEKLLEALSGKRLDGLIHCAATGIHAPLNDLKLKHWDWTMNLNVRAFFDLVTQLRSYLNGGASIVALSSEGAVHAVPNYSLVGASKGALESLCRHMAVELAEETGRVNVLSPGSVLTDAWDAFPDKELRIEKVKSKIPGGEFVSLDEVSSVALFLCSDASRGINGQTIVVDHGERVVT